MLYKVCEKQQYVHERGNLAVTNRGNETKLHVYGGKSDFKLTKQGFLKMKMVHGKID